MLLFACILFVSLLAELIANDKPLILKYKGEFYFPVFSSYDETVFGGDFPTPTDYKDELIKQKYSKGRLDDYADYSFFFQYGRLQS